MKNKLGDIMRERHVTQQELAQALGVSRQAISYWIHADRLTSDTAAKLAAHFQISLGALFGAEESNGEQMIRVTGIEPPPPGYVRVKVFEVFGSCGFGAHNDDLVKGAVDVAMWFAQSLPGVTALDRLEIISSTGDSMSPTIESRALILLDTNQRQVIGDGVFCLRIEGELFIKRLQRVPGGGVTLLSDNPRYPAQTLTREAFAEADVLGRVVYAFNGQMI
jgi:phage repressor protein C with HTH and peptisase S24 domain